MLNVTKWLVSGMNNNTALTKPDPLKKVYSALDAVMEEVILAEEASLEIICSKLQEENLVAKSPDIEKIIGILQDWGKVPANEIKERALRI